MIEASELLHSYAQGIRNLSGAGSVSLYVPALLSGLSRPILFHDGELPPVAELADLESAVRFASEAAEKLAAASGQGAQPSPPSVPSAEPHGCLVALPSVESFWSESFTRELRQNGDEDHSRRLTDGEVAPAAPPAAWLGLKFEPGEGSVFDRLSSRSVPAEISREDPKVWWDWLFAMGGALASHTTQVAAILKDPVTGLPDRAGFQAALAEELEKCRVHSRPLSLLLINPDDFAVANERFGREAGDRVILSISQRLRAALRSSDPVARYGGVIFAAILIGTPHTEVRAVAEKIHQLLTEGAYLDGAVRLGFSIGIVTFRPDDSGIRQSLDLIRRADQALNSAKRLGGGCIAEWQESSGAAETGAFDRLSGIFTGNMAKDYRNMVLLSDALDVIADRYDYEELAAEVVERLYSAFRPERVGLFSRDEQGELVLTRGLTRNLEGGAQERMETVEQSEDLMRLVRKAIAAGEPQGEGYGEAEEGGARICCAVPLVASDRTLGCFFLDGREDSLILESSDLIFLKALASQLAVALDRSRLAEAERRRQEGEKKRLRAELNELRQALQQAKLVYRSAEMEAVVVTARRVAPTDATVLITGESGTGKELLARTVHELSPRRHKPLAIVDCGSIATTLIESELFGHEKGAYTGAQGRRVGRLAEADGGTVLLDEIGELPLEVQSKLLRFVQEKQFTTVGGTRPRRVDVRIMAATNRDLSTEVKAGTFREDLFYRLNVVRLEVPPLRDHPDDILHLARHFVETYAVQYQKSIRRLTPEAEHLLLSYNWPGNVRELQNRLMQAVILCESEELGIEQLQLPETAPGAFPARLGPTAVRPEAVAEGERPAVEAETERSEPEEIWSRLRTALGKQIDLVLGGVNQTALPLGKWLSDDLIIEAEAAAAGIARRGAALVGIPETTFRRRLNRASEQARAGLSPRSGTWEEVRGVLRELVRTEGVAQTEILDRAEKTLLEEIVARVPEDTRTGSSLLGVTAPTFRSRLTQLSAAG